MRAESGSSSGQRPEDAVAQEVLHGVPRKGEPLWCALEEQFSCVQPPVLHAPS